MCASSSRPRDPKLGEAPSELEAMDSRRACEDTWAPRRRSVADELPMGIGAARLFVEGGNLGGGSPRPRPAPRPPLAMDPHRRGEAGRKEDGRRAWPAGGRQAARHDGKKEAERLSGRRVPAPGRRLVVDERVPVPSTDARQRLRVPVRSSVSASVNWLLQRDEQHPNGPSSLFEVAHAGKKPWDLAEGNQEFSALFHDGMVADSSFVMDIIVKECGDVFHGISSLVDVAGGLGGASQAISKAFPHVACMQYIAPTGTGVK
ncbi:hypothetical protein PR202_ga05668 [Eleusine coracana subsp. coracana]|uniref:O-methyltransferase C-terminal domain-containing protein n=1 Tax=Eleusine coracana subsp. coracana TaxID=191504 RepID=A0AAV5BSY1_ELECO|nr:hypothetical protein PR202_ga05214 [Eleusine coracana subsp. coracana]GJM89473.1 hypothetical protein PR202_ga05668 [Eleusine coracana subsp. coracana]